MKTMYINIVFMQGSEANEVIGMNSPEEKLEHLKMFDYGDYPEIRKAQPYVTRNVIHTMPIEQGMEYVLSENVHHESIGLTLEVTEENSLFHDLNDKAELFPQSELTH